MIPPLTPEQREISDDFVKFWHQKLPRYRAVERFNHGWVAKHAPEGFRSTLEVGAGLGEHLAHEKLDRAQRAGYVCLELRDTMADEIKRRFPSVRTVVGDIQERIDFPDAHFDRILAIHVLEHLPNLPAALTEMHRVCSPRGSLQVVIPCEGGAAYSLARKISAQRAFENRYGQSYKWFIEREHINRPKEIIGELQHHFTIARKTFFPIPLPFIAFNLCIGLNLRPHV